VAAAERGLRVVAIDRNPEYLENLSKVAIEGSGSIEVMRLDLESERVPVFGKASFGGIIVSRYLHRPLMPSIEAALAPGGVLLYETFLIAQRDLGWGPRRDAFLLQPGELPTLVPLLETIVYEEGASGDDPPAQTARLLARRPKTGAES
jgi:tellurite methyltransferase